MVDGKNEPCGCGLELSPHRRLAIPECVKQCACAHVPAFPQCQMKGLEAEAPQKQRALNPVIIP